MSLSGILCSKPVLFLISIFLFLIAQILLTFSLGTMLEILPLNIGRLKCFDKENRRSKDNTNDESYFLKEIIQSNQFV